ncbi:toll/interleukin-1 receptor domain-containing protein [Acidovorax sp. Leaf78]|uniref:toll/interleukin-1 receptor domain-containing protein n=1 Tax=Acidovorax sp. Leaf78 TaxID=1736237 RepID=UPI0009E98701|nr:toll/interleukin-1 receptor domain-containing protein [Acidovorax sp. Leaf78]
MIKLFISHSSEDAELAAIFVQLIVTALMVKAQDIRCTSVDGYRLPGGSDTDEQLREEALGAECFIGVISSQSLASAYVLFELGARWGARRHLIPLLAPGLRPQALKGPLRGLNALSCDSMADIHQLIAELASRMHIQSESPAVYQHQLEALVYYATTLEIPVDSTPTKEHIVDKHLIGVTATQIPSQDDDYAASGEIIAQHCEREWPEDFSMRAYCINQQQEAVEKLRQGRPSDIPEEVFYQIRRKCAREWPDDFSMRQYSEEQQTAAYRSLQSRRQQPIY